MSIVPRFGKVLVDLKDWANIQLCDNLFSSVISELKQHYSDSLRGHNSL